MLISQHVPFLLAIWEFWVFEVLDPFWVEIFIFVRSEIRIYGYSSIYRFSHFCSTTSARYYLLSKVISASLESSLPFHWPMPLFLCQPHDVLWLWFCSMTWTQVWWYPLHYSFCWVLLKLSETSCSSIWIIRLLAFFSFCGNLIALNL